MTTSLPTRKFTKILFLTVLLAFVSSLAGYSQYVIDGNYDATEYSTGQVIVVDPTASGTCEVEEIFAVVKEDVFLLGIHNGNAGNAIFRYYFDTDPTIGIDYEVFKGDTVYVHGADRVIQIQANDGSSIKAYTWDGSNWVIDNNGITAKVGDYNPGDKEFIEIMISLGQSSFYDMCDASNDGEIHLATYASFAGGSINSKTCYKEFVGMSIFLRGVITPEFAEYCNGDNTATTFTLSGHWGEIRMAEKYRR